MPEVAEITLTSEILGKYLTNELLISFDFTSGRYSKKTPDNYIKFINSLPLRIVKIDSKGKFLWIELVNPKNSHDIWYIWNTFGLTGMWSFNESSYTRAILKCKKTVAYFSDVRNFGTLKFDTDELALHKKLNELSPDFLKDDFTLNKIVKFKLPIVNILMDQKKIGSGLGNYLVAEILYRAKISPYKLGYQFNSNDLKNLKYWIKYITKLAYIDNHVGYMIYLENESDKIIKKKYHPEIKLKEKTFKFLVYRKKEDPYGNKVVVSKIIGSGKNKRSTYWVPAIQK